MAQPTAVILLLQQALTAKKMHFPLAIDLLKKVQAERPNDFWVNIGLANCLRSVQPQRTEEAIAFRRVAVALRPTSWIALNHLGVALEANGQSAEAIAVWEKAIRVNPDDIISHANLVSIYTHQSRRSEAQALLTDILRLKPHNHGEYRSLVRVNLSCWAGVRTRSIAREAIRRKPEYWQSHRRTAGELAAQGKHSDAEAAAREAVRIQPGDLLSPVHAHRFSACPRQTPRSRSRVGRGYAY